jgi:hypothetical protein
MHYDGVCRGLSVPNMRGDVLLKEVAFVAQTGSG